MRYVKHPVIESKNVVRVVLTPGDKVVACMQCAAVMHPPADQREIEKAMERARQDDESYARQLREYNEHMANFKAGKVDIVGGIPFNPMYFFQPQTPAHWNDGNGRKGKVVDAMNCYRDGDGDGVQAYFCDACTTKALVGCDRCHTEVMMVNYVYRVNGKEKRECWCKRCWTGHAKDCPSCGDSFCKDDAPKVKGKPVCTSCYRLYYIDCAICGEDFRCQGGEVLTTQWGVPRESIVPACTCEGGDPLKQKTHGEDCVYRAGNVRATVGAGENMEDRYDIHYPVCQGCVAKLKVKQEIVACRECGVYHRKAEKYPCGYGQDHGDWRVVNADTRNPSKFMMTEWESRNEYTRPVLFMGFELEIEAINRAPVEAITKAIRAPFLQFKADGTLQHGVEIVSYPMSWAYIRDNYEAIASRWRKAVKLGARSFNTNTCGLHLHLSKDAFGSLHLFKFMKLIYENKDFTTKLSQRKLEHLEQYGSLNHEGDIKKTLAKKAKNRLGNANGARRYCAVNLIPDHTVELRFYKGTLHPAGFFKALEFAMAVYEYTANASIAESANLDLFKAWVRHHKREYPHLWAWIEGENVMNDDLEKGEAKITSTARPIENRQQRVERVQAQPRFVWPENPAINLPENLAGIAFGAAKPRL